MGFGGESVYQDMSQFRAPVSILSYLASAARDLA